MTGLSRQQHDLSPMMSLVRHQVCEDMHNIDGQVQPRHARRRDSAALIDTEFKQLEDSVTASLERSHQLPARHRVSADILRCTDAVSSPQHLDPHAADIVRWAAIIRTVRRDVPGTVIGHNSDGRFSNKNTVTRLLVFQVAMTASARSISRVILVWSYRRRGCLAFFLVAVGFGLRAFGIFARNSCVCTATVFNHSS
jgi:hypothetical protein